MKPSSIVKALSLLVRARRPAFIWGPPGVGKSAVVTKVATLLGMAMQEIRAVLLDPVDLRGLPHLGSDGTTKWAPPDFLPRAGEGILFLDELNAAPALVQAAFYQLVLDRKLGDYQLPEGWTIVAAGNRDSDRAVTTRMPTPLRNRFVHLNFEVNLHEWSEWAIAASQRPEVIAFVRFREELLSKFDRDENAFPSPRTWEFVSDILEGHPELELERELIAGTVGLGAATEFSAFLEQYRALPSIDAILMNPSGESVPVEPSAQYAVASALARRASDTNFGSICTYLERLPAEFSVLCVHDALLRTPAVRNTPGFVKWAVTNHHTLS